MSKLIVKAARPRNPLVAAARFRQAGQHGRHPGAERRDGRQAVKRELSLLDLSREARSKPPSL
jgi:hypothetical protein